MDLTSVTDELDKHHPALKFVILGVLGIFALVILANAAFTLFSLVAFLVKAVIVLALIGGLTFGGYVIYKQVTD